MNDMVPRSRLNAVEHELEKAENKIERVVDNATIEIERLTAELKAQCSRADANADHAKLANANQVAQAKCIKLLAAENTDRLDAWWEMRDEFECSKGPFTSEGALAIMDCYETIGMAEYRKVRDENSQ